MDYFLQQLINGISLGAIYGLIAIGYTMVYGVVGMINFAHGDIYMIGAFVSLVGFLIMGALGVSSVPLAILVVLVLAIGFTAVYGWTVERIAYRPLRGAPRLAPLISAIGVSIFLENYVQLAQGARVKPLAPIATGAIALGDSGAVTISVLQILI
jgi:branched-chain amino acid transport system permease protein